MDFCPCLFGVCLLEVATAWELALQGFHLDLAALWGHPFPFHLGLSFCLHSLPPCSYWDFTVVIQGQKLADFFACFQIFKSGVFLCVISPKFSFQTSSFATFSCSPLVKCGWMPLNLFTSWGGKTYLWSKSSCNWTSRGAHFSTAGRRLEENLHV